MSVTVLYTIMHKMIIFPNYTFDMDMPDFSEIALWEGLPTISLQIGMNGMIFAAGTVGPCLPLTSKITPLKPICILSAPSSDILYTAPISL